MTEEEYIKIKKRQKAISNHLERVIELRNEADKRVGRIYEDLDELKKENTGLTKLKIDMIQSQLNFLKQDNYSLKRELIWLRHLLNY